MQLLLFAHKNEAAAFFHFHQFQLITDTHDLYHDGHYYLLITGEGLWDSLIKLSLALHSLAKQNISISHMVNLGVAGSLRKDLKRFDLCQVRTSYAALTAHHPEFHSHTASPTYPGKLQAFSVLALSTNQLAIGFEAIFPKEAVDEGSDGVLNLLPCPAEAHKACESPHCFLPFYPWPSNRG